jgi:hypothetical protein
LREINDDVRDALRRESAAVDSPDEHGLAVLDLVALYDEVKEDDRLESSPSLEMSRRRLRSRLTRAKKSIERAMGRLEDGKGGGSAGPFRDDGIGGSQDDDAAAGPPEDSSAKRQGGGAWPRDQGAALVEIIERTVAPQIWDINGGQATIIYYEPLRALVVSAPLDVHERVIGLLDGLRQARGP